MNRKVLVIGGNRFFGKRLVNKLIENRDDVTVLNRGNIACDFEKKVKTIICDRKNKTQLKQLVGSENWDIVYDQVCYDATESADALEIFDSITKKYIFTSSLSVYEMKANLVEEDFNPFRHQFDQVADSQKEYAEAKRQCETVFYKQNKLNVCAVRLPIVVGPDDYTNRLRFYIDKIKNQEEVSLPNLKAKMSFIHSADAAQALFELGYKDWFKPINIAASEPIVLSELVNRISTILNKSVILSEKDTASPYGISNDFFVKTDKAVQLGLKIRPIVDWLDQVILES